MEEVFEFAAAAGVEITVSHDGIDVDYAAVATPEGMQICAPLAMKKIGFTADPDCDVAGLASMVKACACISVINIGSLVACGIEDAEVLECVDAANLLKVRSGHLDPETGKFEESADQPVPKFDHVIEAQRQRLDPNRRYGVTQTEFDFCT